MLRPMFEVIKATTNRFNKLVGVEVGVWKGDNAIEILNELPIETLHLVDPFKPYVDGDMQNTKITTPPPVEETLKRLETFNDKIHWHLCDSLLFAEYYKDAPRFDFVYLDGCHTYENVRNELTRFYPLIKNDGWIGGHDIDFYGVMQAVGEFCHKNKIHPHVKDCDWWIYKTG